MSRSARRIYAKRRRIALLLGLGLLVALAVPGYRVLSRMWENTPPVVPPGEQGTIPGPVPEPDPGPTHELPGVLIASIDNKSEARPQSGLDKADMVIEMIAEGGITRYLAFFYSKAAPLIGPIRSARYYFVYIAKPYNTPLAHAGGSTRALQLIADLRVPDLDEIYNSQYAFWRDNKRFAPHNLYTSSEKLLAEVERRGLHISSLPKLPDGAMAGGTPASSVSLVYSPNYKVTWQWQEGKYLRSINGQLHKVKDGPQIVADNLVIMSAVHRDVVTDVLRTDIDIIGSGSAKFLRNGQAYTGTWKKASANDHFEFTVEGQPYKFQDGITWMQVIMSMDDVTIGQ